MLKKTLVGLLSFLLVGCQAPLIPLERHVEQNTAQHKIQHNTKYATNAPAVKSTAFQLKNNPVSDIRKTLLSPHRFVRQTGAPVTETVTFQVDAADLSRKFLLNVNSGPEGTQRLSSGWLSINGTQVIGPDAFNQQISGTSVAITNLVSGQNELQVRLASGPGATIDVSLEGFADPADIPGAVTSEIPHEMENTSIPIEAGMVGIKFREGMRVRLQYNPDGSKKFIDLNGINLTPLVQLMATLNVRDLHRGLPFSADEMDQDEQAAAALLQTEIPNGNLFYLLEFDTTADVWGIIQQMRALPFVETAFPQFVPQLSNHPGSEPYNPSTEPGLVSSASLTEWLKVAKIMEQNPGDGSGAWHFTKGKPSVKIAVVDGAMRHSSLGLPGISNTHEEFINANITPHLNFSNLPNPFPIDQLAHGTSTAAIVSANGSNSKGGAGVAHGATTYAIGYFIDKNNPLNAGVKNECNGAKLLASAHPQNIVTTQCDLGADSIIWAMTLGAKVIIPVINTIPEQDTGKIFTIEQAYPLVRVAIIRALQQGVTVVIPAGNGGDTDISQHNGKSMFDTGSIVVGGLNHVNTTTGSSSPSGTKRVNNGTKLFNYGLSQKSTHTNGLLTASGHGTDVSGIAEQISAPSGESAQSYNPIFGGTSAASPTVGGVVALMLSVNPNLTPLEIRKILRDTRQQTRLQASERPLIAGMVNAFEAVKIAGNFGDPPSPPGGGTSGLVAAFYPNTIYNPKELLPVFINKPYAAKIVPSINFPPNDGDAFGVGLTNYYLAEFTGMLNAPTAGIYQLELRHDDGVILKMDGQTVINVNHANSFMNTPSTANVNLSAGNHTFQLMYYEATGGAGVQMRWQPPNSSLQDVPTSAFSHSTSHKEFATPTGTKTAPFDKSVYSYESGYVARFFAKNVTTWPQAIFPANYPFLTRSFSVSNTVPGNTIPGSLYFPIGILVTDGDPFEIGQADNFSVAFSGFIRPEVTGSYNFTVCHDDGINFYIEETLSTPWKSILSPGPTAYRCDAVSNVQLVANQNHRYVLHYDEKAGGAIVELRWQRSGQAQEVVPARVMFH